MVLRWVRNFVLGVILLSVIVFSLWMWASVSFTFSTGERAGFVQKLSKRGWLVKTWEGELAMVNLPGAMPEVFHFSVRNDEAVAKIQAAIGKRVSLRYDEHRFIPLPIFGETSYFARDVRLVEEAPLSPAPITEPDVTPKQ